MSPAASDAVTIPQLLTLASSTALKTLEHILFRRSFELVFLTLVPYQTLNLFLGPLIFDSKHKSLQGTEDNPGEQDGLSAPQTRDETRRHVPPMRYRNLTIRTTPHTTMMSEPRQPSGVSAKPAGNDEATADSTLTDRISVGEFVRKFCPTLFEHWEPSWWLNRYHRNLLIDSLFLLLRSGHLQTFWSSAGDFSDVDLLKFDRCEYTLHMCI